MASIPLAEGGLDRAAHRRLDKDWLEAAFRNPDVLVLVMQDGKPLMDESGHRLLWLGGQAGALAKDATRIFLGEDKNGSPMFALGMPETFRLGSSPIAGLGEFTDMRKALGVLGKIGAHAAATARSLMGWHDRHGFCANCGSPSDIVEAGWKRVCPNCGAEHFPRTDPVAIMLPVKGEKCLLGRGPGWPAGFYSCLAGFVEPGETAEMAAARETLEEAGVKTRLDSARYLFAQPWPFPSSLMIGIIIEAETEEITIDPNELQDARWVSREECQAILNGEHDEIYCPPEFAVAYHIMKAWAFEGS